MSCSACFALYGVVPGMNFLQAQETHSDLEHLLSAWVWYFVPYFSFSVMPAMENLLLDPCQHRL